MMRLGLLATFKAAKSRLILSSNLAVTGIFKAAYPVKLCINLILATVIAVSALQRQTDPPPGIQTVITT